MKTPSAFHAQPSCLKAVGVLSALSKPCTLSSNSLLGCRVLCVRCVASPLKATLKTTPSPPFRRLFSKTSRSLSTCETNRFGASYFSRCVPLSYYHPKRMSFCFVCVHGRGDVFRIGWWIITTLKGTAKRGELSPCRVAFLRQLAVRGLFETGASGNFDASPMLLQREGVLVGTVDSE